MRKARVSGDSVKIRRHVFSHFIATSAGGGPDRRDQILPRHVIETRFHFFDRFFDDPLKSAAPSGEVAAEIFEMGSPTRIGTQSAVLTPMK